MSSGLIALLDDVAALAKAAAASIDDVAAQAGKAGAKAAGVVIDDAAVTPRYVAGLAPSRELPIVARIAMGSLRNKLVFLLPAALALGLFAPWAITPLLMLGGAWLCFEGAEKVVEAVAPHAEAAEAAVAATPEAEEEAKVAGAIRTDFILSAEIMAVTLAAVPAEGFWTQAAVLATVGIGITLAVYGAVALLVKLDDAGVALAARGGAVARRVGLAMVRGMAPLLAGLGVVGTVAMLWVGGGILLHGLETLGAAGPAHAVAALGAAVGAAVPDVAGAAAWLVESVLAALAGLAVGLAVVAAHAVLVPPVARLLGR
jgi:predicted DNA repair protein MutK